MLNVIIFRRKKEDAGTVSDEAWDAHKIQCPAEYSELANIHLESAVAIDTLEQAYNRGIVFPTLVVKGDNDTVGSLNASDIYKKRGIDMEIQKIECLSHVMRTMMNNLFINRVETGTLSIEKESVESQPNEIENMTLAVAGRITHYYNLALKNNVDNLDGTMGEIQAIPLHLGANDSNAEENHQFCPFMENSWCNYKEAKFLNSPVPPHTDYLSKSLVEYVTRIFTKYRYNDVNFVKTIRYRTSTNNNEVLHSILKDMLPKRDRPGMESVRLGAALAIIRFNDGYSSVFNIFKSFQPTNPFIRTKEGCRLLDNKRIQNSKLPSEWTDTYHAEQVRSQQLKHQIAIRGSGYSSRMYSGAQPVEVGVNVLESEDESQLDK